MILFFSFKIFFFKSVLRTCCSDELISIHYMKSADMIRIHTVLNRLQTLYEQKKGPKPTYAKILEMYKYLRDHELAIF